MAPIAKERPVILFDNKGVGETNGRTPETITEMAQDAATFIKALDLNEVDLLGFSIGGMVAQELALQEGDLIRRYYYCWIFSRSRSKSRTSDF